MKKYYIELTGKIRLAVGNEKELPTNQIYVDSVRMVCKTETSRPKTQALIDTPHGEQWLNVDSKIKKDILVACQNSKKIDVIYIWHRIH